METARLNSSESAAKLASWQACQRDFLNQNGLKRQSGRERIFSVAKSNKTGIISGAITNPDCERAQKHAERYYELVRKMPTDFQRIARK